MIMFLGGNAGMAAAHVARKMGLPATIVVPSSSPPLVVQNLRDQGATVKITGEVQHLIVLAAHIVLCQFSAKC